MKKALLILAMLLLPMLAYGQAILTFEWDVVTTDINGNPITGDVNYAFYVCSDSGMTSCDTPVDVMEGLQYQHQFDDGRYYVAVKAWTYLVVNSETGEPLTDDRAPSDFSNVIPFRVQVPPGNPANTHVRLIAVP